MVDFYVEEPDLYPLQHAAFNPENGERFICIEASTKSGKTFGAIWWLLKQAWDTGGANRTFCWLAPVYGQSKEAYRRTLEFLTSDGYLAVNESELRITLHNGSVLLFKSGEYSKNLFGANYFAAVVDEASHVKADSFDALITTLSSTEGPAVFIGNVHGRRNWFYQLCRTAEQEEPNYHYAKLTAQDAISGGVMTQTAVDTAKGMLPEGTFREKYLVEPQDDAGNPFGLAHIEACLQDGLSDNPPVAFGVDLAKSSDYTVIIGLDDDGNVCVFERFQLDWDVTERMIEEHCFSYDADITIDSTGVGDPIYERLSRSNNRVSGFKFSNKSKTDLMTELQMAVQEHKIGFPDNLIAQEMRNFAYVMTESGHTKYEAMGGHDDCVIALALAWHQKGDVAGWGVW